MKKFIDRITLRHAEGLCHMWYKCEKCGKEERLWNSRPRVTPFMIGCSKEGCDGTMQHENFHMDEFDISYQPKSGDRVFIDMPRELYKIRGNAQIDELWEKGEYPLKDTFESKEKAIEAYMKQYTFGMPMVEVIP